MYSFLNCHSFSKREQSGNQNKMFVLTPIIYAGYISCNLWKKFIKWTAWKKIIIVHVPEEKITTMNNKWNLMVFKWNFTMSDL